MRLKGLQYMVIFAMILTISTHGLKAQYLEEFEKKVTEFTLDNGLHFIVIERHDAPVASFYTQVNVGGIDEPVGNKELLIFLNISLLKEIIMLEPLIGKKKKR